VTGITRIEEALEIARLGIDAVGLHLAPGDPRHVGRDNARAIIGRLPPWITRVAVVDAVGAAWLDEDAVRGFDALEVRDPGGPDDLAGLPLRAYPSLALTASLDARELAAWAPGPVLLRAPRGAGGAAWTTAQRGAAYVHLLLGGALGPGDIEVAVRLARPHGLVLGEGVEREPGRIDVARLETALETLERLAGAGI